MVGVRKQIPEEDLLSKEMFTISGVWWCRDCESECHEKDSPTLVTVIVKYHNHNNKRKAWERNSGGSRGKRE